MASGRGAFARSSGADTLAAALGEEPKPLTDFNPAVPVELQTDNLEGPAKEEIRPLSNRRRIAGGPANTQYRKGRFVNACNRVVDRYARLHAFVIELTRGIRFGWNGQGRAVVFD
jgi:hypothetical protein